MRLLKNIKEYHTGRDAQNNLLICPSKSLGNRSPDEGVTHRAAAGARGRCRYHGLTGVGRFAGGSCRRGITEEVET